MKRPVVAIALSCVCLMSACSFGPHGTRLPSRSPAMTGVTLDSIITSGGRERQYRLFVPTAARRRTPLPLVFVLHGGGLGTPAQVERHTQFDTQAQRRGWLVAYPAGVSNTWNAGTCCAPANEIGVDDDRFIADLIDRLSRSYRVDAHRVYATGISNGGMLAYRLGCDLAVRFAAIAPVAASMTSPCAPPRPVSVLHIHGLVDKHVAYNGGVGSKGFANDSRPSVLSVIQQWRSFDGCPLPTTATAGHVTTSTSAPCNDRTAVTLITIDDMGHTWPGGFDPTGLGAVLVDPANNDIDATAVIADFFASHSR